MNQPATRSRLTPVGLVGGMGWESPTAYYRILNEEVRRRFGGTASVVCHLHSLDFAQIEPFVVNEDWASLAEVLRPARTMWRAASRLVQ